MCTWTGSYNRYFHAISLFHGQSEWILHHHRRTHVSMDYRDERCVCCASIKRKKEHRVNEKFLVRVCCMLCVYLFGTDIHVTHKRRLVTTTTSTFLTDIRRYVSPYSHLFRGFSFFLLDYIFFFIFLIIAWIYYYFTSTHTYVHKTKPLIKPK